MTGLAIKEAALLDYPGLVHQLLQTNCIHISALQQKMLLMKLADYCGYNRFYQN